ncbi:MAG: DEAD/DEAH box helicase [Stenomitos rutilans HA7619-LM2]|nr:DEAD/DEAH box helicase [Stenomitos rutilans HA7619-LM2]
MLNSYLQSKYRWALTGTPIENRLEDVVSLFAFIRPGTFLTGADYSPRDVSTIIEPFMLRRLKEKVLQDLPDKERQEFWLDLDNAQRIAYDQALNAGRRKIETSLDGEQTFQTKRHIFALLVELKQICNFAKEPATSPKTFLLLELLETIAANQKKVLIFSQYRIEGTDKIDQLLTQTGIRYVFYKGTQKQKDQAVSDFRNNPETTVFLATLETAGYGITLTEATYVIHFDQPWNPAKMQNAEDRVHRIGQTKGVTIFNQQGATIGVNYAASGSKQEFTQNATTTEQNFEILLADFEQFINDLQRQHPNATDETAIQIIDVEVQKQPIRLQNFLNLKRLWNGGKKAAVKVGEHFTEQNPWGKGAIAFLDGVMEEPK